MKITGRGLPAQSRPIPEQTVGSSNPTSAMTARTAEEGVVPRIASAIREMGVGIPDARLATLAAELESIGVSLARLDAGTALRALFLSANGISLTPALLQPEFSPDALVRGLAELADAARAVLADPAFPGDVRTALSTFVRDAEAWMGARNDLARLVESSAVGGFSANIAGGADEAAAAAAAGLAAGGPVADNLRALVRNGGFMFEWRLLAWHRAGADPAQLASLAGSDLKGMLLRLLAALDSINRKSAGETAAQFGEMARSLADKASAGQIAALFDNTGNFRSAAFDVPFPATGGSTTAQVFAEGEKDAGGERSAPGGSSLAFSVETANLGTVRAHVRISKGMLSAVFVFRDERARELAEGMADEFRAMLADRGLTPVTVRFAVEGADDAPDVPELRSSRSLDVRG